MNLTTARLEVRERIGELTADFFTDSEVDRAINEAVRRFSNEERWPWLLTETSDSLPEATLATDESDLDLPDGVGFNRFESLYLAEASALDDKQPRMLERVNAHEGFRLRHAYFLHASFPRWYYVVSATMEPGGEPRYVIRFLPSADKDYDVFYLYYRVPVEISAGGEDVDVPQEYADAIPAWAAGKLFLKEQQVSQKASEQFAVYGSILEQAKADFEERTTDTIIAVGREHPGEHRVYNEHDYVMERIGGTVLG